MDEDALQPHQGHSKVLVLALARNIQRVGASFESHCACL